MEAGEQDKSDFAYDGLYVFYERAAIEVAVQQPVPNEQEDVDKQEQVHSWLGRDHETAEVQQEEQQEAGKVEEEEAVEVPEESVVVQGYRVFTHLVRFVVRSIVGYSCGLDP